MNEILLTGCAPTPLAHYLKALGVLKILSEQKDENARGCWTEDGFLLKTELTADELSRFFLEDYRPSPILAPWNGRAGYLEEDDAGDSEREGAELVRIFRNSNADRFSDYRSIITTFDENESIKKLQELRNIRKEAEKESGQKLEIFNSLDEEEWSIYFECFEFEIPMSYLFPTPKDKLNILKKQEKELKDNLIIYLRNEIPENQIQWIDALVALGVPYSEKPQKDRFYSPLMGGAGGVEGSMDIGVNFMKNIKNLFSIETGEQSRFAKQLLFLALFEEHALFTVKCKPGSLLPGKKGGLNSTNGFSAKPESNPWDFVLMIEGSLLFITSISRRMESSEPGALSFPFAFRETSAGAGKLCKRDEKNNNSEIWVPQWNNPCGIEEIIHLLRDARMTLGRTPCQDGLDVSRALTQLGASKGIESFTRHAFITLPGGESLSTTLGNIKIKRRDETRLLDDLDRDYWLSTIRSAMNIDGLKSVNGPLQHLENKIFQYTQNPSEQTINSILIFLGQISILQTKSSKMRKACSKLPSLSRAWTVSIKNPRPEFRIACSLASIGSGSESPMRLHLFPLLDGQNNKWRLKNEGTTKLCTWSHAPFTTEICRIAERRLLASHQGKISFGLKGASPVNEAVIAEFLNHPEMDNAILELLPGLCLVRKHYSLPALQKQEYMRTPLVYRLLKPFFCDQADLVEAGLLPEDVCLPFELSIIRHLSGNQVDRAITTAVRRLRMAGLEPPKTLPDIGGVHGKRLLTALMIPVHIKTLQSMAAATFKTSRREAESSQKTILISTED